MRVRWRERSQVERVEWQTRVMLRLVNWLFFVAWSATGIASSVRDEPRAYGLAAALVAVNVAQCLVANRHIGAALDQYLGRRPAVPRALTGAAGALALAAAGLIAALVATGSATGPLIAMSLVFAPMPFAAAYALTVPVRVFARGTAAAIGFALGLTAVLRPSTAEVLTVGGALILAAGITLLSSRCSAWSLAVMWQSERSREIEARLAVAEERLRFGRDLHDVLGRNLAVVALKSELAVQLARRGRTEDAVAQMTEVQRIAQESQREVREVVRGYRDADLGAELSGARGVLTAAGIECTVTGSPAGLRDEVQSALGWVVREATTNVLRHGDATRCAVELRRDTREVVLTVENDGADKGSSTGRGTGLAGLRERLAQVDGTLEAGVVGEGAFRVTASVPVEATLCADGARQTAVEAAR